MKTMDFSIVSAEASIFNGTVYFLAVSGQSGELGIYPGHTALLTLLKPGQVRAQLDVGQEEVFYISGGILEIQPSVVTILADTAVRAGDLDQAAAVAAKQRVEKMLEKQKSGIEYSRALTELAEATAQLRAIEMLHKHLKR